MWCMCCDVMIRTAQPCGSVLAGGPGNDRATFGHTWRWHHDRVNPGEACTIVVDCVMGGLVHRTCRDCVEGVQLPNPDNRTAQRSYGPENSTPFNSHQWAIGNGWEDADSREPFCRSQTETSGGSNLGGSTGWAGWNDTGSMRIWWEILLFAVTNSQCCHISSARGLGRSTG